MQLLLLFKSYVKYIAFVGLFVYVLVELYLFPVAFVCFISYPGNFEYCLNTSNRIKKKIKNKIGFNPATFALCIKHLRK